MSLLEHWILQITLADVLRDGGILVANDRLSFPFVKQGLNDCFVAAGSSCRIVEVAGGGRFLCEDDALVNALRHDGPFVLSTEELDAPAVSRSIEFIGRSPDVLIHHDGEPICPGFQTLFPDVFVTRSSDKFIEKLASRAHRYETGEIDPLDSVRLSCEQNPFMKGLLFRADRNALIEFSPLPLVREADPNLLLSYLLSGDLLLKRWQPVTLRIPIFAIPEPEILIRVSGNGELVSVLPGASADGGVASIKQRTDAKGQTILRLALSRRRRSTADVQISGHNVIVDAVMVGLSSTVNAQEPNEIDPLDRYADPLNSYDVAGH